MDNKCIICDQQISEGNAQLLISLDGEYYSSCLQHEGSQELKDKISMLLTARRSKSECSYCPGKVKCYGPEVKDCSCRYYNKNFNFKEEL
jgi:hypothetical protein